MIGVSLEKSELVLSVHLFVGVGLIAFGLFLLWAGSIPGAIVNVALGGIVGYIGYRMAEQV